MVNTIRDYFTPFDFMGGPEADPTPDQVAVTKGSFEEIFHGYREGRIKVRFEVVTDGGRTSYRTVEIPGALWSHNCRSACFLVKPLPASLTVSSRIARVCPILAVWCDLTLVRATQIFQGISASPLQSALIKV